MKHCAWCYCLLDHDIRPIAFYRLSEKDRKLTDPKAGDYCPGCASQWSIKPRCQRILNPNYKPHLVED